MYNCYIIFLLLSASIFVFCAAAPKFPGKNNKTPVYSSSSPHLSAARADSFASHHYATTSATLSDVNCKINATSVDMASNIYRIVNVSATSTYYTAKVTSSYVSSLPRVFYSTTVVSTIYASVTVSAEVTIPSDPNNPLAFTKQEFLDSLIVCGHNPSIIDTATLTR
jgi:hypothetical protein